MQRRDRLVVHDVSKRFPHGESYVHVLDSLSLHVADQEFVAIVGPSGCGKSTLLEIICGLQSADSGWIELDGKRPPRLAGEVAYMPQQDHLMPWRRTMDNVILPLLIKGVPRDVAKERAREWLDLFGLAGFENAYPGQLSGGMRQRAALMRTFLTERDVVALDEPFGALDAHTRRRLQGWLGEVRREFERTVLLITHDVDEALLLADRVAVLSHRPAKVVADIRVDLPSPRNALSMEFVALKGAVLEHLDKEAS